MKRIMITIFLAIIVLILGLNISAKGQSIPHSIKMIYSDTSCKFDETEVQSIFNSKCLYKEWGYVIYSTYFPPVFLCSDKTRLPNNYKVWAYQLNK